MTKHLDEHFKDTYRSTEKDIQIKQRICKLMEVLELCEKDLADRTLIHRTTIHRMTDIKGERAVRPYYLVMLTLLTGVSKDWLEKGVDYSGVPSELPIFAPINPAIIVQVKAISVPSGSIVTRGVETTEYEFIRAVVNQSGKSTLCNVVGFLVPNGERNSSQNYTVHANTQLQVIVNNRRLLIELTQYLLNTDKKETREP